MAANPNDDSNLEQRLRLIEDRLEIYNLIASHPPSADTAAGDYTARVLTVDTCKGSGVEGYGSS
jgi:transcription elongation GreA/GreB family factor